MLHFLRNFYYNKGKHSKSEYWQQIAITIACKSSNLHAIANLETAAISDVTMNNSYFGGNPSHWCKKVRFDLDFLHIHILYGPENWCYFSKWDRNTSKLL